MDRQKVTLRDIARNASVSASAVSLVINDKPGVSTGTRERVRQVIAELGYEVRPDGDGERPPAVGLLIERSMLPAILDSFYGEVIQGFQAEAQRLDVQVVLHMFDRRAENLANLQAALAGQVQGLVVANDGDITPELINQLQSLNLPLVLIENTVPGQRV